MNNVEPTFALQMLMPQLSIFKMEKLTKGTSNDNYWLDTSKGALLLKCYRGDFPKLAIDAQHQFARQTQFTHEVIAWNEQIKAALFSYIPQLGESTRFSHDLPNVLHALHLLQPTGEVASIDILPIVAKLKVTSELYAKPAWQWSHKTISQRPPSIGFCHNDLVVDNILNTQQGTKLIDFEYAAYNDVFFDLAALCCSFDLSNKASLNLLEQYLALNSSKALRVDEEKLMAYQIQYLLLSIDWYEQRGYFKQATPLRARFNKLVVQIPPRR